MYNDTSYMHQRVKNTPLPALDCGDKAAAWICKVLQSEGLRLNYSAPSLAKRLSCKVAKDWKTEIHADDEVLICNPNRPFEMFRFVTSILNS